MEGIYIVSNFIKKKKEGNNKKRRNRDKYEMGKKG